MSLTELHAGNDTRVCARAIGIQNLDGDEADLLCNAERLATNSARNVTPVAVLIGVLEKECEQLLSL